MTNGHIILAYHTRRAIIIIIGLYVYDFYFILKLNYIYDLYITIYNALKLWPPYALSFYVSQYIRHSLLYTYIYYAEGHDNLYTR